MVCSKVKGTETPIISIIVIMCVYYFKDTDYFVIIGQDYTALRANWEFSKSEYTKNQLLNELKVH